MGSATANQAGGGAAGTTLAVGPLTVAVDDLLVVMLNDSVGGATPTIEDNLGNEWRLIRAWTNGGIRLTRWSSSITVAGAVTATITFNSSNQPRVAIMAQLRGGSFAALGEGAMEIDASPVDTTFHVLSILPRCPFTGVLTRSNEIVLGFWASETEPLTSTFTAPDVLIAEAGNDLVAVMSYLIVSTKDSVEPQRGGDLATGIGGTASFRLAFVEDPYIIPGYGYLTETGSESYVLPGYAYVTEPEPVAEVSFKSAFAMGSNVLIGAGKVG